MAMIQLFDRQIIAKPDVQNKLRGAGIVAQNRTNEEIDSEVLDVEPLAPTQ